MTFTKTIYTCQQCSYSSLRWLGKCPECEAWNSFVESVVSKKKENRKLKNQNLKTPLTLEQIPNAQIQRLITKYAEFNRVSGGGIVPGSVILVGGEPGIGKSTLFLQLAASLSLNLLYISAEESLQQIKLRAERMNIRNPKMAFLAATKLEEIIPILEQTKPEMVIVDSIQTVYSEDLQGTPGSIGQVRECAQQLTVFAKKNNIPIFIIGHITKEGTIAGPKTLEHLVDVVLYLEGERFNQFRIMRSVKNRFGPVDEVGIFQMRDKGLIEITNPSEIFLSSNPSKAAGSVVVATLEGTRTVLVELQALTVKTVFGYPRRAASGVDLNRLFLLTAVLSKKSGLLLDNQDIYLNVTGGLKISEPAIDLGIVLSIYSSFQNKALPGKTVVFGEIGLSGELRSVNNTPQRLQEIERLGMEKVVMPKTNINGLKLKLEIQQVQTLKEALEIIK